MYQSVQCHLDSNTLRLQLPFWALVLVLLMVSATMASLVQAIWPPHAANHFYARSGLRAGAWLGDLWPASVVIEMLGAADETVDCAAKREREEGGRSNKTC